MGLDGADWASSGKASGGEAASYVWLEESNVWDPAAAATGNARRTWAIPSRQEMTLQAYNARKPNKLCKQGKHKETMQARQT